MQPFRLFRRLWDRLYRLRIRWGLDRAYGRADVLDPVQLDALRVVVFSDHHRGTGTGADDFKRCEATYRAALGWYLEQGYALWLLGDVEELWESRADKVMERYRETLALEAAFGPERLRRFYGNHDMAWRHDRRAGLLGSYLPKHADALEAVKVHEAVKVPFMGRKHARLFLVHGHQGTLDSGNLLILPFAWLIVRFAWGPLQRWRGFANTLPSADAQLREKHDRAMFAWARGRAGRDGDSPVLIAGHTHRPVFPRTPPPDLRAELAKRERELEDARAAQPPDRDQIAHASAELQLVRTRIERSDGYRPPPDEDVSCYFNTGCCSFGDGDVTGLELAEGQIRLVRWPNDVGQAKPERLACRSLDEVLTEMEELGR